VNYSRLLEDIELGYIKRYICETSKELWSPKLRGFFNYIRLFSKGLKEYDFTVENVVTK
jgi:hypothetical protein